MYTVPRFLFSLLTTLHKEDKKKSKITDQKQKSYLATETPVTEVTLSIGRHKTVALNPDPVSSAKVAYQTPSLTPPAGSSCYLEDYINWQSDSSI